MLGCLQILGRATDHDVDLGIAPVESYAARNEAMFASARSATSGAVRVVAPEALPSVVGPLFKIIHSSIVHDSRFLPNSRSAAKSGIRAYGVARQRHIVMNNDFVHDQETAGRPSREGSP
jgi:hypothetical protein